MLDDPAFGANLRSLAARLISSLSERKALLPSISK